jgi:hypothetical protein
MSHPAIGEVSLDLRFRSPEVEWMVITRSEHRRIDEVFYSRRLCCIDERAMAGVIHELARLVAPPEYRVRCCNHGMSSTHGELNRFRVAQVTTDDLRPAITKAVNFRKLPRHGSHLISAGKKLLRDMGAQVARCTDDENQFTAS